MKNSQKLKNHIEDKRFKSDIMNLVYRYEAKRTYLEVVKYAFLILIFLFTAVFTSSIVFSILKKQSTFDLLILFIEDFEIIKTYFFEVIIVFYEEAPKLLLLFIFLALILFSITFYSLSKNFTKIKNRLLFLRKYFRDR